jgi:hypothetical protein
MIAIELLAGDVGWHPSRLTALRGIASRPDPAGTRRLAGT